MVVMELNEESRDLEFRQMLAKEPNKPSGLIRRNVERRRRASTCRRRSTTVSVAMMEESNAGEVQHPIRGRSSPGKMGWVREEFSGWKSSSPVRKGEVSPEWRANVMGTRATGRSLCGGSPGGEWRKVMRKTGGESGMRGSGRRSRSSGSPLDSVGRPTVSRSGLRGTLHSHARVPMSSWEDSRRVLQYGSGNSNYGGGGGGDEDEAEELKPQDDFGSAPTESLENPLLSLECFIFL